MYPSRPHPLHPPPPPSCQYGRQLLLDLPVLSSASRASAASFFQSFSFLVRIQLCLSLIELFQENLHMMFPLIIRIVWVIRGNLFVRIHFIFRGVIIREEGDGLD